MKTLDEQVKEELEARLDYHFPTGNANRAAGLALMTEAFLICRRVIRSEVATHEEMEKKLREVFD